MVTCQARFTFEPGSALAGAVTPKVFKSGKGGTVIVKLAEAATLFASFDSIKALSASLRTIR